MTTEEINELNNKILDLLEEHNLINQNFENENIISLKLELEVNQLPKIIIAKELVIKKVG